jgi:hypothetical protein
MTTAIWSAIKDSQNALDFAQYLKDFPQGCNRVVALFKLRQMVPESIALTARIRVAGDGAWYQAPNGGFLTHGDNVVQSMTIGFDNNMDPAKLSFSYTCDAAGKGGYTRIKCSGMSNQWTGAHSRFRRFCVGEL